MYIRRLLWSRPFGTSAASKRGASTKTHKFRNASLVFAGSAAVLYASSGTVRDDVDFAAHVVQRGSTVAVALSKCVYYYRRTLYKSYGSEDERVEALKKCHKRCALITRDALERNAGIFIKLGQHISALSYIFPEEWTRTMVPLQDQCPVSSFESVKELVQSDLGQSVYSIFSEFDEKPMGTASLAQVHHAKLRDGSEVAVKIQHPSLQRYVPLDVRLTETVFKMVDYFFPEFPLQWLSDEMRRSVFVELDFTSEARNAKATAAYFKQFYNETALRIPTVYWAKPRIICMEFVTGIRPDNREELVKAGIDVKKLSLCFAHLFNNMIFTPGVGLHCDPHAGNIAIRPTTQNKQGFEVVLYDHGLYRYVDTHIREAYAHFWMSVMDGNCDKMKQYAHDFAGIEDQEFNIFAAAITGRDFDSSTNGSVTRRRRSKEEIENMQRALREDSGLASQIMQMLHHMPPVVLLILKTNDLVRYLDEALGTPLGVTKQFVVMGRYCARTIFLEQRKQGWKVAAWLRYWWTNLKLSVILVFV